MQTKVAEKYFFFGLLLAAFVFTFLIFRPFWAVFVLGASFAILIYPVYQWFLKIKFPSWVSAFLTVLLFALLLTGPLLGIGLLIFDQSENVYHKVVSDGNAGPFLESIEENLNEILPSSMAIDVQEKTKQAVSYISRNIANIFSATFSAFFYFILMLLVMFYFLKDGEKWKKAAVELSPLGEENNEKLIGTVSLAVDGVIKGSLLMALVQGVLLGVGFSIFGISNAALWGVVAAVLSLVPTFGTALVSVPAIIFLFAIDKTASAIGLLLWAGIVVGMVDNFLGPIVVGRKINVPSILILFSVLGGIALLGPVGILVGPLSVSVLHALVSIYKNEFS